MFLRALAAFLVLPVMVAGVVPWLISRIPGNGPGASPWSLWGWVPVIPGMAILLGTVVSFYRRGKGTLAPWDPPRHLVVQDLYRFNRNPMYLGVILIVAGWAIVTGGIWNVLYAMILPLIFHLRVVRYEEPQMRRLFGEEWEAYRQRVPRWGWLVGGEKPRTPNGGGA